MSMQISVDPTTMTTQQREAVADFILTYPAGHSVGTLSVDLTADTSKLKSALAEIHDATDSVSLRVPQAVAAAVAANPAGATHAIENEITHLAREGGEFDASVAFGGVHAASAIPSHELAAAAAFGSPAAPLPPGAAVAPSPAAALAPALNTAHAPTVELDKNGLPWDGRIHAESKNKIADGTWRRKRNLDPALLATVEAELRSVMGAPAAPNVPSAAASPAAQVPVAPPAAPPAPPAAPSANAPDARAQFVALIGRASAAIQHGKATQAEVTQCCVNAGVPALPLLANRLDLVAAVAASVDALIASRG